MKPTAQLVFPPFRLDPVNEQLWRETQLVPLRPKAFAVLRFLVEHAGRLLTKEELLQGVWPHTQVSEGILKGYIRDLREVLGDNAQRPQFIETVPRRGHRFIAAVTTAVSSAESHVSRPPPSPALLLVGRDTELAHLHSLFAKAVGGERQMVFVTGEPGIGKTTLVDAFLAQLAESEPVQGPKPVLSPSTEPVVSVVEPLRIDSAEGSKVQSLQSAIRNPQSALALVGRGQCVEQYGTSEAYLPVLEALGRMGRAPGGEPLGAILQQYAPTWLVQMPALLAAEELEAVQRRVVGATRERMLREMLEAIEALAAYRPLVLWLEDLHWADASTVDWLAAVARREAPARLLVIGTYRPSDLSLSGHPLRAVKQELVAKRQSEELWLPFLSAEDVSLYLTRRYTRHQFPSGLGAAIHRRTDGNPLFVVNMVDYLATQEVIAAVDGHWRLQMGVEEVGRGVPANVRQLIEKHLERLSEEHQRVLAVASVAGVTFSTAALAAGLEAPIEQVEEWCEELVKRGQFLQTQEPRVLPDGLLCGSYGFQHALQQAVVYERIPSLRRVRWHRRVGDGEEQLYGARAHEIAAELAVHFERGGDLLRAVHYRQHAGHTALRQHGYQEAIVHFTRGLDLLATFPDTQERRQQELALLVALGAPLQALEGYGAPKVEAVYTRARALAQQSEETAQLFPVLRGLYVFYLLRGKLQEPHELGERLFSIAQSVDDPALLLEAHFALGQTLMFRGELIAAQEHLDHGITLYDPARHRSHAFLYGQDPGVFCRFLAAWNLCLLGYPDQGLKRSHDGLVVAQEAAHPLSLAAAWCFFAMTHQFRREGPAAQEHAEAAIALCSQHGFPFFLALATMVRGWALAEQGQAQEGIVELRQGLAAWRATGAELTRPRFMALLAEAWGKVGQPEEGLNVLTEALAIVNTNGECDHEAEVYRLTGELTLQQLSVVSCQLSVEENQKAKACPEPSRRGKKQKAKVSNPQPLTPNPHAEAEAEACFHKAIDIARRQEAKSLELRAVVSLSRLWQRQGKRQQARHLLAKSYGWFTEGFDTADLQEARQLLAELS
ncbi:MAG: ATP-binding protein [Candidatus Binatia bacterium]